MAAMFRVELENLRTRVRSRVGEAWKDVRRGGRIVSLAVVAAITARLSCWRGWVAAVWVFAIVCSRRVWTATTGRLGSADSRRMHVGPHKCTFDVGNSRGLGSTTDGASQERERHLSGRSLDLDRNIFRNHLCLYSSQYVPGHAEEAMGRYPTEQRISSLIF